MSETRSPRTSPSGRQTNEEHTDRERRARTGTSRDPLGRLRDPRVRGRALLETSSGSTSSSSAAARRTSPRGSRGAARAPTGVDPTPAQLATARRMHAAARARVPARRGAGRVGAAAGRDASTSPSPSTAPRSGRIPHVDAGGGAAAAARRPARLPHELDARLSLRAADVDADGGGAPARAVRDVPHPVAEARSGIEYHLRTATGSRCCARTASRSRRCTSCSRATTAVIPATTTSSPSSGRGSGPPRRSG